MESRSFRELQPSTTTHNPVSDIVKEIYKEASCPTTSGLQNSNYNNHIIGKEVNQSFSQSAKISNVSNSVESINFKLDRLIYPPLGTEKLGENFSSFKVAETPDACDYDNAKRRKVDLYGPDVGPKLYNVKGNLVTPPIIAKNLPEIFNVLPIFGRPGPKEDIEDFYSRKIREFVGCDLNDEQFENLANECSPDLLRTGSELRMTTSVPTLSVFSEEENREYNEQHSNLCVVRKHQLRMASDSNANYQKKLKYRGIRLIPLAQTEDGEEAPEPDLDPGRDIIYVVRIYRPFPYNIKEKHTSSRHSVFSRSVVLAGRRPLSALRDRVPCANDVGMRVDVSAAPHEQPDASAKDLFPSGFLFINNVFYVDGRAGCADRSAGLRAWARARGLGAFVARDLHSTRLDDLTVRLGHPEVYVHQGNCEHLFTFSEIRLLNPDDPLSIKQYPVHTAVSQNQTVYCTTCAEFGAKWIVTNCSTVPFDPAYFCDTCFRLFLYKDGKKIGDFKAFSYRGNEINMLKPSG
ncbi:snRNA-activating protein complex subunit 3 isoform X1 [Cydia pomonella]|uniref:snRNA-activating protein complex subunit 3 isoform X1 n=2 Tax=Cydia pomonella TaxID=82600 RepID=UPI002ADDCAE4|nr:snRNA-activating protein complex subunit 3 isoform X1 [Cydia pomonella]